MKMTGRLIYILVVGWIIIISSSSGFVLSSLSNLSFLSILLLKRGFFFVGLVAVLPKNMYCNSLSIAP